MNKKSVLVAVVLVLLFGFGPISFGGTASFQGLGYLPGSASESEASGVSGDGKVVVGHSHNGGFWWSEETGMLPTTSSWHGKVSFDGSVVASTTRSWRAFQWTANSGVYSVVSDGVDVYSISMDISDDGSIIVGKTLSTGFIWKPGVSFDYINGTKAAYGISADGTIVVGEKSSSEAFKWTLSGQMIGLGRLPGSTKSKAHAISADGQIIVGESYSGSRNEAFLWTEQGGMIGLGYLPGSDRSWAKDISADGRIVIGLSGTKAFIWDHLHGMRDLKLVLEQDYNLNLTGWRLVWAQSISADGTVIVGRGYNPEGNREAWVARIAEPGPANTFPVACIVGGDGVFEAGEDCEAMVVLDGSCSSDADSTTGTNDDINDFEWYIVDACDPNFEDYLGSGEVIECNLPLGENIIVLEVTDKAGAFDSNEVVITVEDVTPPELSLTAEPNVLWPANHKMVLITVEWEVSDNCDDEPEVRLVSVTSSEEDDGKGDGATSDDIVIGEDGSIYLRAESVGYLEGRVYTITYEAVDDSGNTTLGSAEVLVPDGYRWRHLEHKREREGAEQ